MLDKILLSFLIADGLFAATGGLLVAAYFVSKADMVELPTIANVATNLVLEQTPLTGRPSFYCPITRSLGITLRLSSYTRQRGVGILCIRCVFAGSASYNESYVGKGPWMACHSLRGRDTCPRTGHMDLNVTNPCQSGDYVGSAITNDAELAPAEGNFRMFVDGLQLNALKFNCCGYIALPFQQDSTCTNAFVATQKLNCVGPFGNFANSFLDLIFTAMFGIVGMQVSSITHRVF